MAVHLLYNAGGGEFCDCLSDLLIV